MKSRVGANERDLADVLPGDANNYLENRGISGKSPGAVLKHLVGLYRKRTTLAFNPMLAQSQLDTFPSKPWEPTYCYASRIKVLATAVAMA
jgi:hypothetical protein